MPDWNGEPSLSFEIVVEVGGRTYAGRFDLDARARCIMLTVSTDGFGSRTTELGATPPRLLARMILQDLVEKGLSRGRRLRKAEAGPAPPTSAADSGCAG
jgi:hypothetical protein